jgi:hypothetical protein
MSRRFLFCLGLVTLLGASGIHVFAAPIVPNSYTFNVPTACGSWCYSDNPSSYTNSSIQYPDVFTKLTDGIVGNAGWAANAGKEWDGWLLGAGNDVKVHFNFGGATNINSISIGSTQDSVGDVALPSFYIYYSNDDLNWTFVNSLINPPSSANDNYAFSTAPQNFYTLSNLGIDAQYVRMDVVSNGPWAFVDEVTFDGSRSVPEPGTFALALFGLTALAGYQTRRRQYNS